MWFEDGKRRRQQGREFRLCPAVPRTDQRFAIPNRFYRIPRTPHSAQIRGISLPVGLAL